jgi:hypothetical protein
MNVFKDLNMTKPLVEKVNWKAVKFQKVIADSENIIAAYKVIVNGVVVGAIGKVRNSIAGVKSWVWVEKNESFKMFHFDKLSYSRRWAVANLLNELRVAGALDPA